METGDIIIVLDEKDHDKFQRKGSDLIYKMVGRVLIDSFISPLLTTLYKIVAPPHFLCNEDICSHFRPLPSQEIELSEALCGFQNIIKPLDNRELVITSHPGDVIKHGKRSQAKEVSVKITLACKDWVVSSILGGGVTHVIFCVYVHDDHYQT